jgi:hypothetical protein
MIKSLLQLIQHFILRPDKILITIILPLLILITLDYDGNISEYKKFMLDRE